MLQDQVEETPYNRFPRFRWELGNLDRSSEIFCCIHTALDCGIASNRLFHLNNIAKAIVIVDVKTARGRKHFSKSRTRRSGFECSCQKLSTTGHHELSVLVPDSTLAKACIIPRVTHFQLYSTRVTEFLQLQLDCRFEIQIYDRTQNIRKFIESSISNLQYSGSEPAQNRF
jgi:hypothetical protein